jgi:hypothetical protein
MEKERISVAGFTVYRLGEGKFEAENLAERYDFYFDETKRGSVDTFVFDSDLPTSGPVDPCVASFSSTSLDEAVVEAMSFTRRRSESLSLFSLRDFVERLRLLSNELEASPGSEARSVLFPGWDDEFRDKPEPHIKETARAILAEGVEPDEGTYVPAKSIAALLHFIADMMDED